MSEIIDTFALTLAAERDAPTLTRLDPAIITDAAARTEELTEQARAGNVDGLDELDALVDMVETLAGFRRQKIVNAVGRARPSNMLPAEVEYFDQVTAATVALHDAWGVAV